MKQRSINEYIVSPLSGYKIQSSEWLGKSCTTSNSTKMKTRSISKKIKSPSRNSITEAVSPLGKWIQHTRYESPDEDKNIKGISNLGTMPLMKSESSKECDVISSNIDKMKEEWRILGNYDLIKENDNPTKNGSLVSPKMGTRSRSKSCCKKNTKKSPLQKPTKEVMSPLEKWMHQKKYNQLQNEEHEQGTSKLTKEPFSKRDSFEKYGVILPSVDDILKNMNEMKEEGRILDNYDDLFEESDISIPETLKSILDSPEKSSTIPLLDCEHLTQLELKAYALKYLDYLKNISKGVEFSQRHQTYKDHSSRSKLTGSSNIMVFKESQLVDLMTEIEKPLDPEEKHTEYLFMVILPELCLRICMDEFDMSREETIQYLNQRLVY